MEKQKIEKLEKEATRLIHLWCKFVSFMHHKNCDGIWWIEKRWDWYNEPKWYVVHQGYLSEDKKVECESYEEALEKLIETIKEAFKKKLEWAEGVLKFRDEYDDDQIKAARWLQVAVKYEDLI